MNFFKNGVVGRFNEIASHPWLLPKGSPAQKRLGSVPVIKSPGKRPPQRQQTPDGRIPVDPTAQKVVAPPSGTGVLAGLRRLLATPVSGASLAIFRIAVGIVMLLEAISCFRPSASTGGRVPLEVYYTGPDVTFSFPYEGFGWLPLLPPRWMEAVCVVLGISAVFVAVGLYYRVAATITFLAWGYLYAIESTRTYWMSYYYLEVLLLFLLIWMPAATRYSLDALRSRSRTVAEIPFWPLFLLRSQLLLAYFYAGIAKVNRDWLFEGVPMRMYLEKPHVIERLKAVVPTSMGSEIERALGEPWLTYFLSWSGAAFDLTVGFLLIVRRTRTLGMLLVVLFHATNHFVLFNDIVWFPLVGVTTALIFLEPDWPVRFAKWIRSPTPPKPDWKWFLGGGVLLPGIGVALGWKSSAAGGVKQPLRIPGWVLPATITWCVWQTLTPLRHLLIPGDARFTFEGLSWSWRLKTEVYGSRPCVISIHDPALVTTNGAGETGFNWSFWPRDKVLYRQVQPDSLNWSQLPEFVVVLEPLTGERIFYNLQSRTLTDHSETAARTRVDELWRRAYGHPPESIHRVVPLGQILEGYERAMRPKGLRFGSARDVFETLVELNGREGDGQMVPVLRRMEPFSLAAKRQPTGPLLVIEDRALFQEASGPVYRLNLSAWKNPLANVAEPLVVLRAGLGMSEKELLPRYYVADHWDGPGRRPEVRWNLFRDVGPSKAMHVGMQPFLLRRYAQRVAAAYQREFQRRPEVHALTSVSLNGHPGQAQVDPDADLASVPLSRFGHNSWIRDYRAETGEAPVFDPTLQEPLRSLEEAVPTSAGRARVAR